MRKFLYSPGFGAGWITWMSREIAPFALGYQPIIEFLESGGQFIEQRDVVTDYEKPWKRFQEPGASVLRRFYQDAIEYAKENNIYDDLGIYLGGARDLRVGIVPDGVQVRINEYDGNESYSTRDEAEGEWL